MSPGANPGAGLTPFVCQLFTLFVFMLTTLRPHSDLATKQERLAGQELINFVNGNPDMTHRERCVGAGYLKDFLFSEAQLRSPVKSLSGGEKARLLLAKIMTKESKPAIAIEDVALIRKAITYYLNTMFPVEQEEQAIRAQGLQLTPGRRALYYTRL